MKNGISVLIFALYSLMLYQDWFLQADGNQLKFVIIVLVGMLSMERDAYLRSALALTVVCDFLLLFTKLYTLGVTLFCIVHILHLFRYGVTRETLCRNGIAQLCFCVLWLPLPLLYRVSASYAGLFLLHLQTVWSMAKEHKQKIQIALLLFACCDMLTALFFVTGQVLFARWIWAFYVPSQMLLACSPLPTKIYGKLILPKNVVQ